LQDSGELRNNKLENRSDSSAANIAVDFIPAGFEFLEIISTEGASLVYKARNQTLDQVVTIKVLRSSTELMAQSNLSLDEAKMLADLNHRNIVKLLQVGTLNDATPYLVYEFVDGHTLRSHLLNGPLVAAKIEYFFEQLLEALAYVHAENLIHRDIKPENIIIDDSDVLKILDFGIAGKMDENTGTYLTLGADTALKGTPLYMSPEQCERRGLTTASDIYSAGCVLFECLTGSPPFRGDSPMETIYKHTKEPIPELPDLYEGTAFQNGMQELMQQLLSKSVSDRPNAKEFAEKLRYILSLRTATRVTGKPTGEAKSQRFHLAIGIIAAAVIIFVLATMALLDHSQKTSKLINGYNLASADANVKARRLAATAPKSLPARIIRVAGDFLTWQRNGHAFGENEFMHFKTELYSLLKVAKSLEDRYAVYVWLARAHRAAGEYDDSIANYRAALALCKDKGGKQCLQASQCYLNIGDNYTMKGEYKLALDNLLKAASIHQRFDKDEDRFYLLDIPDNYHAVEPRGFMVRIQDELGTAYFLLHDYKNARKHIEHSRSLWEKPDEPIQFVEGKARLMEAVYRLDGKSAAIDFMKKWEADAINYAETFKHVSYRYNNLFLVQRYIANFCDEHPELAAQGKLVKKRMEETMKESEFDSSLIYKKNPFAPALHR
jgi:serine/threonine protein kinase